MSEKGRSDDDDDDELVPPRKDGDDKSIDIDQSSHSETPQNGPAANDESAALEVTWEYVGTAARLTSPPPSSASMPPAKSILRRHSAYGNDANSGEVVAEECEQDQKLPASVSVSQTDGSGSAPYAASSSDAPRRDSMLGVSYNGITAPLSGNEGPIGAAPSSADMSSAAARTTRRHSLLVVSYNGETTPLAGGTSASATTAGTTTRRHSMLGVAYNGMMAQLAGGGGGGTANENGNVQNPAPSATRRHSMLGVSYGAMTAPLSSNDGQAQDIPDPMPNPITTHRRLSMPKVQGSSHQPIANSASTAERRLSMPRAEIGAQSRETISRSSSLAHSSTSSVIDQTRRLSLTEIQDFLDDDDDDDESDDEVDLGGDGERMSMSNKAGRRLSMPRAEIGAQSRETIRSHSLTTLQIETRRLSLTEVQTYLDGDSSDEEDGMPQQENGASANVHANSGESTNNDDVSDSQPSSPPGHSRRHSIASASSRTSLPRSILRRHSSYGSNAPPEEQQYVRPDLIRLASLQQRTTSRADGHEEARRDRSTSIGSTGSSVSFSSVSVRSHSQTLGDHPCCRLGPPIALDWQHQDHQPVRVDDWEKHRVRDGGPNSEKMYIPPHFRRHVLEYRYGHSREETTEAARVARMARRRRSMTRTMLPMAGIEEAGETVAGFAKKVVKSGRQVTQRKKATRRCSSHF